MNLLQWGQFVAHSGRTLDWKIECDAFTEEDWACAAGMVAQLVRPFVRVIGVPRGGLKLAEALEPYKSEHGGTLIVDDVLTSGGSMWDARRRLTQPVSALAVQGAVLFARGSCPQWIVPVFQAHKDLW